MSQIEQNVRQIVQELPEHVQLVAAAKTRTASEVEAAIRGGIQIVGYNYVQEAQRIKDTIKLPVRWHLIGHLQKNKVKKAIQLFDMIETVDSAGLAVEIDKRCRTANIIMPVLIEINSGRERNKAGVMPEETQTLIKSIHHFKNIKLQGLMTMGPFVSDPEELRPYFKATYQLFKEIQALDLPNVEFQHLSMGMSDSYHIAIEEGATIVRIGTRLFGARR